MSPQSSTVRTALSHAGRRVLPESTQANPRLRQVIADRREIAAMTRERVSSPITTLRFYLLTTPGKLLVIMLALVAACVLTGIHSSSALNERKATLENLIETTEPLAESAEVLYSSLSVADAAANSAFVAGGRESPLLRQQYADAIASSGTALIASSRGGANHEREDAINDDLNILATQIPTYTGVIETARTNNRLGYPLGSSYLVEASSLMQDTLLPAAQRLYEQRSSATAAPQRTLTTPPWGVYVALLATILMLVGTGRYLARRTRRHFNVGLAVSTAAVVIGMLWLLVTGLLSVYAANTATRAGAEPLHELTTMRIQTQQARSVETLSLVRRGDTASQDQAFQSAVDSIRASTGHLLSELSNEPGVVDPLNEVESALTNWENAHREASERLTIGDFEGARDYTIGTGEGSAATGYRDVNDAILRAINQTRSTFRQHINTAQQLLGYTGTGIGLLCFLGAIAAVGGLIPRFREYR